MPKDLYFILLLSVAILCTLVVIYQASLLGLRYMAIGLVLLILELIIVALLAIELLEQQCKAYNR